MSKGSMKFMFLMLAEGRSFTATPNYTQTANMSRKADVIARHTDLSGAHAIVTGGTKGIGRACVEECAVLGAKVLTCSRKEEELQQALDKWKAAGYSVQGIVADVSTVEGRHALIERAKKLFGSKLQILINNAGTNIRNPTAEYTAEDYRFIMATNLDSAFLLTQACYPLLKAAGSSSIVNISSVAGGPTTVNSGAPYAATKAAMDQLCRYLACEWAQDGIRVNGVKPGYIATPLVEGLLKDKAKSDLIISRTPMRRVGDPQEIAGLVAFLCSRAASYLTGQSIAVDGAYSVMGLWPIS